jgi:hypothetical protein
MRSFSRKFRNFKKLFNLISILNYYFMMKPDILITFTGSEIAFE